MKSELYSRIIFLGLIFTSSCGMDPKSSSSGCKDNKFFGFSLADIAGTWETGTNPSYSESYRTSPDSDSSDCGSEKHAKKMSSPSADSEDMMSESSASTEDAADMSKPSPGKVEGGGQNIGPQILTAGTFDDSLNFDSFKSFWIGKKEDTQQSDIYFDNQSSTTVTLPSIDQLTPATRFGGPKPTALDLSLVVDVTGSMSDELEYIKAELEHISASVKEQL